MFPPIHRTLLTIAAFATCYRGIETSTLAQPPIQSGLVAYLDADEGVESSTDNPNSVAKWQNTWGKPFQVEQSAKQNRPKRMKVGPRSVIRFDGQDDSLRASGLGLSTSSATIFVVAAVHENPGDFRGLLAFHAPNRRDYESGINIDLGPGPTTSFDVLNIEGRGFGGARNLLIQTHPFGELLIVETIVDHERKVVSTKVNGKEEGSRPCQGGSLDWSEMTVGARYYTNGPGEQQPRGHFPGDIAAIMAFDRVLSMEESKQVTNFLSERYSPVNRHLKETIPNLIKPGVTLQKATNPPLVQMLIPGFEVQEIPIDLTNRNNVRYRADGTLVALGYNGDIDLLTDTDGDGLEDTAKRYWTNDGSIRGPIGMVIAPAGYSKGQGVLLASKGKVSMIVDRNGDDLGDEELIVASGWKEIPQNVDAVGLAMANDESLFFGIGTANYANAYMVDDKGNAAYDLSSDRGTVQRISPDWSTRETVCTGIRFPIAFAFHPSGHLFCTEQEGATWLPNGNPFDELLHIRLDDTSTKPNVNRKQHFGFPPRHPKHNPLVIDEPSTVDYGPQHQSTCGMVFNEPVHGGPIFGPPSWSGDAIVCGESRGKLWRTKIVPSHFGYVGQNHLIACLQMLTVDACVSPRGDLIVACHSGPPDWGTGPQGKGKLFRIRYKDHEQAQPIATWAKSASEIQIAFDRPIDPLRLKGVRESAKLEFGSFVRAGDRFETLVPPYAVVKQQQIQPRYERPVSGIALSHNNQILSVYASNMIHNDYHALQLPLGEQSLDLDFSMTGVAVDWKSKDGSSKWSGVLPHVDLEVSRMLIGQSASQLPLWNAIEEPGTIQLETIVDLKNMLRPPVQPGSSLDFELPPEIVTIHIAGPTGIKVRAETTSSKGESTSLPTTSSTSFDVVTLRVNPSEHGGNIRLIVESETGTTKPLQISYSTQEDDKQRPFELRRFILPWIDLASTSKDAMISSRDIPELAGGSWGRGRHLFHDERTLCSKCHAIHGVGAIVGPDLGNLIHRDYGSVLRDIVEPSHAINPDYLGYIVSTVDSETITGVARSENDDLLVGDATGKTIRISKANIDRMKPTTTSIMPTGLLDKLSHEEKRDLLTFLLTPAPRMPLTSPLKAPPLRSRAEVMAALEGTQSIVRLRKLQMILVDGVKDHGPGEHDYPAWKAAWQELLRSAEGVEVHVASEFPDPKELEKADILIFFQKGNFTSMRATHMDKFLRRGGGLVLIHWAVNGNERAPEFAERIGFASEGAKISYRHGPLTLNIANKQHPIMRNFERLELYDESYWRLSGDPQRVTVLATSEEEGKTTPQIWIRDHMPGRVFVSIPGHYSWTFDDPLFRLLMLRGIAWSANEPLDRFNDLVFPGARILD